MSSICLVRKVAISRLAFVVNVSLKKNAEMFVPFIPQSRLVCRQVRLNLIKNKTNIKLVCYRASKQKETHIDFCSVHLSVFPIEHIKTFFILQSMYIKLCTTIEQATAGQKIDILSTNRSLMLPSGFLFE